MRACDILDCFQCEGELLRLTEIANRTGINKATTFRLLNTLEHRGLVERVGGYHFRPAIRHLRRYRYRIGYATRSVDSQFVRAVTAGLDASARSEGFELIAFDNRPDGRDALKNAAQFIRRNVDLVIEFQLNEAIASQVSVHLNNAGIPLIAVDVPLRGSFYFGADNFGAGVLAGRTLARHARHCWAGRVDEVVLLTSALGGGAEEARLAGMRTGLRQCIDALDDSRIVALGCHGQFAGSVQTMQRYLRRCRSRYLLVGALNDSSALGALQALEQAGRTSGCAVVGQHATAEARAEMRRAGTALIGSVGYFPEQYGERVLALAVDILQKRPVPPSTFIPHKMITPANVDHFYPNDVELSAEEPELALVGAEATPAKASSADLSH